MPTATLTSGPVDGEVVTGGRVVRSRSRSRRRSWSWSWSWSWFRFRSRIRPRFRSRPRFAGEADGIGAGAESGAGVGVGAGYGHGYGDGGARRDRGRRVGPYVGTGLGAAGTAGAGPDAVPGGVRVGDQPGAGQFTQTGGRHLGGQPRDNDAAPGSEPENAVPVRLGNGGQQPPLSDGQPPQRREDRERPDAVAPLDDAGGGGVGVRDGGGVRRGGRVRRGGGGQRGGGQRGGGVRRGARCDRFVRRARLGPSHLRSISHVRRHDHIRRPGHKLKPNPRPPQPLRDAPGRQGMAGREFTDPPGAGAARLSGRKECLGGGEGGAWGVRAGDAQGRRVVADPQQGTASGAGRVSGPGPVTVVSRCPGPGRFCDQAHIAAERRHIAAAVVQDEEETAGQRGRGLARAEQSVQLTGPQPHVRRGVPVQSGQRGGEDVAEAFVAFGGQQAGVAQQGGEPAAAVVREAAEFRVAAGGEGEMAVPEPVRGAGQRLGLTCRQVSGGQSHSGEMSVGGGVQPQRSRAGVTAVPYGRFGPVGPCRGGGRHGREHTHGGGWPIRAGSGQAHGPDPHTEARAPVPIREVRRPAYLARPQPLLCRSVGRTARRRQRRRRALRPQGGSPV
ncbi:hypothetical protein BG653_03736 [Streptomyces platensis]|uniref:Uncharacterized protein n=1 Tax=Streptomyces platensis TaxID=58346 RepID=A0ABX3XWH3_STRPT|nr:hypothetical protein BG653_03736 [Streptomyces platensis]